MNATSGGRVVANLGIRDVNNDTDCGAATFLCIPLANRSEPVLSLYPVSLISLFVRGCFPTISTRSFTSLSVIRP